jgi:uncharacterized protein (TIGR03000 family)
MYELVLMMALSNSPGTTGVQPEADTLAVKTYGLHGHQEYRHRRRGCCGGCYGGYGGCYGGGYGGCMGGYGGYGCYGGGYGGCMGGYGGYGCTGGYAMYGGSGGVYASFGDSSGFGGYAGYSTSSPMMYSSAYGPGYSMPLTNFNQNSFGAQPSVNENRTDANQATLVVDLPANAKLLIDGQPTQLTSATRTFITPPLKPGQEYYYDLKAELNRDGKTLAATKRVTIRPGQESRVRLDFSGQTATTED